MEHLHDEERPTSPVAHEALYLSPAEDLIVDDESLGPGFSSSRGLSIMRKWLHLVGRVSYRAYWRRFRGYRMRARKMMVRPRAWLRNRTNPALLSPA